MASEGRHHSDYDASLVPTILGEAAYVCRSLGFPGGHLVIVGGLVPSLLVPTPDAGIASHVGSRDLDFCMRVALLAGDVGQYEKLDQSLLDGGFKMLKKENKPESWRWRRDGPTRVTVEFLCPIPGDRSREPGQLHRPGGPIAGKLSALVIKMGTLVDGDVREHEREVELPSRGGRLSYKFQVAGPASWIAAKIEAVLGRTKNKDSYDLVWLAEAWPGGQAGLAAELRKSPVWSNPLMREAMEKLAAAFNDTGSLGPVQYSDFLNDGETDFALLKNRAVGAIRALVNALEAPGDSAASEPRR